MKIVTFNYLCSIGLFSPYYDSPFPHYDNYGNGIYLTIFSPVLNVNNPDTPKKQIESYSYVLDTPITRKLFPNAKIYDAEPLPPLHIAIQGTTPIPHHDEINELFFLPRKKKVLFFYLYSGRIEGLNAKGEPRFSRYMFRKSFTRRFGYDPVTGWPDEALTVKVDYSSKA